MRKLVLLAFAFAAMCLIAMAVGGCGDKKPAPDAQEESSTLTDTARANTIEEKDTLESIVEEIHMPKAADELFDDFLFNFAANGRLQMRRIAFPLPVCGAADTSYIEAGQWKKETFFMSQDYYTLIFDNIRQMEAVKDTSVRHAVIEKLFLEKDSIRQYVFDRRNGEWRMTAIREKPIDASPNASFLRFYSEFATDSTFQAASINDPLKFSSVDPEDDFSSMEGLISAEQWPSFAPELPTGTLYNIVYGHQEKGSNQKIFIIRGIANGFETEMTFQKKGGKWVLVALST